MAGIILSVDIGTSSLKASYIDLDGKQKAFAREPYGSYESGAESAEVKDAAAWEQAFILALEKLHACAPCCPDAVCISGNGPTLVPVKADGEPLPPIHWYSGKSSLPVKGAGDPEAPSLFLPHVAWFKENSGGEYKKVKLFFSSHEWLANRLGSDAYTALPSSSYELYYWNEEQLRLYGLESEKFPPFIKMGSAVGHVSKEAASFFSANRYLKSGIPIISGGPDFITALIGTAVKAPGEVCDRAGSSEGINVCAASPVKGNGLRILPHAIEGLWNISVIIPASGSLFEKYRTDTGQQNRPYEELLAELIPSSFIIPYSPLHTGRAVLCEIGFTVRSALKTLNNTGLAVSEMRLSGGQSRSALWNQLKADIIGVSLMVPEISDGELAGNAVLAAAALEGISRDEAADKMIRIRDVYRPRNSEFWEEEYGKYEENNR